MAWAVQNLLLLMIVFILALWYVIFLWKRRKLYFYSWNVPGPIAFPIIGTAYQFFGCTDDILEKVVEILEKYPSPVKIWLGPRLVYGLYEPEHVEKVLTSQKCLDKDYFYKFIIKLIGTGLLTAPTEKWRRHRKVIMPAFHTKILESFVDVFAEHAMIFTEVLKSHAGRKDINIGQFVACLTLDIICETAMGLKMNTQRGQSSFAVHLEKLMELTTLRIFKVWHHLDWTWRLYPASREMDKHLEGFRSVTSAVIKKKMKAFEEEKQNRRNSLIAEIEEGGPKKRMAFLDLILKNSKFTEEELKEEVEVFLIAGTDTSGTTLCFLLEMLGLYPEIQQKVYEEAVDILGEDRPVEAADLPKFVYTERVLKETMRLFPVGVYFVRTIGGDIDLGTCVLPEGSAALFSTVNLHRNPKYWPDPLRFDPDRFLPEEVAKRPSCAFIPFAYGPRGCIGAKYAMMNMKTFIATTIRKYRVFTRYKSINEIKLMTKIVLRPKHGFKVYLDFRENSNSTI